MSRADKSVLLPPGLLGRWVAERWDIWQEHFLDASALARYAREFGVDFSDNCVEQLWALGLLRADLVMSSRKLPRPGLIHIGKTSGGDQLYADERQPRRRARGWGGAAARISFLPVREQPWRAKSRMLHPFFHPYRYYVLYRLNQLFDLHITRAQPLHSIEGFKTLVDEHLDQFQRFTASRGFLDNVGLWNSVAALAVAAEPEAHERITGRFSHPAGEKQSTQRRKIAHHTVAVCHQFQRIGLQKVEKIRSELCRHEQRLDPNRDLHTLVRLSRGLKRSRLNGELGGAMLLRNMAETLRRTAEQAFRTELPEEDEIGSSAIYRNAKRMLYGSNRILDDIAAADSFLTQHHLKIGRQVHWYVEGDTEFGGLERALGSEPGIVIINLRGQFAAKRSKGVGFQEDLANDLRTRVCSIVSFDGDVDANLRALRVAVERGKFFGRVYLSRPCFEIANFTVRELGHVLWQIAFDNGAKPELRSTLQSAVDGGANMDDLLKRARTALPDHLGIVKKDATWGEYLIKYGWAHQKFSNGPKRGQKRPIVDAIEFALRAAVLDYGSTFRLNKVQPVYDEKGNLVSVELVRKEDRSAPPSRMPAAQS